MKTSSKFAFAFCAAAVLPILAFAVERTWVGQSGGKWTDASNWNPSGNPTKTDVLVFKPEGELVVAIAGGTCSGGGFRFESGSTIFATTGSTIYMGNVSNYLYVADGASVVVSNRFCGYTDMNNSARLVKTGNGRLIIESTPTGNNDYWHPNSKTDLGGVDFLEGETVLANGGNFPLYNFPIFIQDGATLRCGSGYRIRTNQPVCIASGGVLDLGGTGQYVQSILGEGSVINQKQPFTIYLNAGSCAFKGRIIRSSDNSNQPVQV